MKAFAYIVLVLLVLVSLAFDAVLIGGLVLARRAALPAIEEGIEALSDLEQETFETAIRIQETLPIAAQVPFERSMAVPIRLTVPVSDELVIRRTVELPLKTAVGSWTVAVPISVAVPLSLTVPISVEVPIQISETFPISTQIDLDLEFPISLRMADTSLPGYVERFRSLLQGLYDLLAYGQW